MAHPTRNLLLWLGLLVVITGAVYAWYIYSSGTPQTAPGSLAQAERPVDAPAPRPQDYAAAQQGFQHLVSYTETGFAPKTLNVKKGETVRFTNNSASALRLALAGKSIASLAHSEYFENTFTAAGSYVVSADDGSVTIVVK